MDDKQLRAHFGHIHAQNVAALSRHLITCRRFFDGDMDLFLVPMINVERTVTRPKALDLSSEQWPLPRVCLATPSAIHFPCLDR